MELRYSLSKTEIDSICKVRISNKLYVDGFKGINKKRIIRAAIRDCANNNLTVKEDGILFNDLDFFIAFNNCESININDDIIIIFFNIGNPIYIPFRVFKNNEERNYLISKFEVGVKKKANLYAKDFVKSN